jgi:hypothetical protein
LHLEPALVTTPTVIETRRNGNAVGERKELARYSLPSGERVLYGQRISGVVRIVDVPRNAGGRSYLVERELELDGYAALQALVSDYVSEATRLNKVPMATSVLRAEWSDHIQEALR